MPAIAGPGPRLIDLGNPVADHPLNMGLTRWWLGLPNNSFGTRLFDLKSRKDASLSGCAWINSSPVGAQFGALHGGTATDGGGAFNVAPSALTYSLWLYSDDSSADYLSVFQSDGVSLIMLSITVDNVTSGHNGFVIATGGGNVSVSTTGFRETTGNWVHYALTADGTTVTLYRNGVSVATSAMSGGLSWNNSQTLTFVRNSSIRIADFRIASQCRSAPSVWGLYDQSRRGYPDLLRRYTPAVRAFGGAASGPPAAFPPLAPVFTRQADNSARAFTGM